MLRVERLTLEMERAGLLLVHLRLFLMKVRI